MPGRSSRPAADRRSRGRARPRRPQLERLEGLHCVLEALRARRREMHRVLVSQARGASPGSDIDEVLRAADSAGVAVEWVEADELRAEEGRSPAGRVALDAGPLPDVPLEAIASGESGSRRLMMLDGVEDPQNLGAIARVAEASGTAGLVLGQRRAAPLSPAASRASAGALEWLPVARVGNLTRAIENLKGRGFWVLGAAQQATESLFEVDARLLRGDLVVILGSEGKGLRPSTVAAADHLVQIPLVGHVESLNVSSAGAVVMFELMRRANEPAGSATEQ